MSINTFKKMIMVSSFALILISANAQDREDKDSLVSTGIQINSCELRTWNDAKEDSSYSGLAKVAFDQLVTQPCQAVLSTASAFCKFSYQHPATALAMTATFTLPVVAALMPDQSSNLWYPQFTCARTPDIQQINTFVGSSTQTLNFAPADGRYQFSTNYTTSPGYSSAASCAYQTSQYWYGPGPASYFYTDEACKTRDTFHGSPSANSYQWGQANYTGFYSDQNGPGFTVTSWCARSNLG